VPRPAHAGVLERNALAPFDPEVRKYQLFLGLPDVYTTLTAEAASGGVTVDGAEITGATQRVGPASLFERSTVRVRASGDGEGDAYEVELVRSLAVHQTIVGGEGFGGSALGEADVFEPTPGSLSFEGRDLIIGNPVSGSTILFTYTSGGWAERAQYGRLGRPLASGEVTNDFGAGIALGNLWLAVGLPRSASGSPDFPGQVLAFPRGQLGKSSDYTELKTSSSYAIGSGFGSTVATVDDLIVVGAPNEKEPASEPRPADGAVYVYEYREQQWQQVQKLAEGRSGKFGLTIALDSETLAVAGGRRVFVYRREQSRFTLDGELAVGDGDSTLTGDVAIDGERIAVSNRYFCLSSTNCLGRPEVKVFAREAGKLILQATAAIPEELTSTRLNVPDVFAGHGLVLRGSLMLISATAEGSGTLGLQPPSAGPQGSTPVRLGTVYVFEERDDGWRLAARLGPPPTADGANPSGGFGRGLALSGGLLAVVSAYDGPGPGDDVGVAVPRGAVHLYGPDCSLVPEGAPVPGCSPSLDEAASSSRKSR
jgi:hypothetical protein